MQMTIGKFQKCQDTALESIFKFNNTFCYQSFQILSDHRLSQGFTCDLAKHICFRVLNKRRGKYTKY
jgi:hypothetical protein